MMRFLIGVLLACCCAATFLPATSVAQEITLKRSLLFGWRYSSDGLTYRSVGVVGNGIQPALSECEPCLRELRVFRRYSSTGLWLRLGGIALAGYAVYSVIDGDEWDTRQQLTAGGGLGLFAIGYSLGRVGTRHLKSSIALYNSEYAWTEDRAKSSGHHWPTSVRLTIATRF